jgi:hypothetical protein
MPGGNEQQVTAAWTVEAKDERAFGLSSRVVGHLEMPDQRLEIWLIGLRHRGQFR